MRISVDGRKRVQKKNDDRKLRRRACLWHAHRVSLTSQRAILSFSKVLGRLVENALKRYCGRESIDVFSVTTKTHTFQNTFVCTRPYFISDKVIAMNIKRMRVHFLSDSFDGAPSADLKVPRISLDAQTRVLELAWWISRLGQSTGIPRSWTGTWYGWTSF